MPIVVLTPQGGGASIRVKLDDSFNTATPAAQQKTLEELTSQLNLARNGSDSAGAALASGLGNAGSGLATLAGTIADRLGYKQFAQDAFNKADSLRNAGEFNGNPWQNLKSDIGNAIQGNDVGTNLANAGASAVNLAAQSLPSIAAGVGLAAVPGVGPGLAAGYFGANAAGNTIQTRMDAENETNPTDTDLAAGGVNGVVQAGLGLTGIGRAIPGAAGAAVTDAVPGVSTLIANAAEGPAISRVAAGAGLAAGAGGAGGAAGYVADTAGTPNQPTLSGTLDAAGQGAVSGAIARAATMAPGLMAQAAQGDPTKGASLLSLASASRVSSDVQNIKSQLSQARGNDSVSDQEAIKTGYVNTRNALQNTANLMVKSGYITPDQKAAIFTPALAMASTNGAGLGEDIAVASPDAPINAIARIQSLGLPPELESPIVDGLRDLDTYSQGNFWKPSEGAAEMLGRLAGKGVGWAAMATLFPHGFPLVGPELGHLGLDLSGYELGSKLGGSVGRAIDAGIGNRVNPVVKAGTLAQAAMAKNGIDPGPSSLLRLQQAQDDMMAQLSAAATAAKVAQQTGDNSGRFAPLGDTLVQHAVANGGVNPSSDDLSKAIDDLARNQTFSPATADFYKGQLAAPLNNRGQVHNDNLTAILRQVVSNLGGNPSQVSYGQPTAVQGGAGATVPNGGARPVQNAYQFNSAANTYQARAAQLADMATRAGPPGLDTTIMQVAMEPSVAKKQAIAHEYISSLGTDVAARAAARRFLNDRLLTQGKP